MTKKRTKGFNCGMFRMYEKRQKYEIMKGLFESMNLVI